MAEPEAASWTRRGGFRSGSAFEPLKSSLKQRLVDVEASLAEPLNDLSRRGQVGLDSGAQDTESAADAKTQALGLGSTGALVNEQQVGLQGLGEGDCLALTEV